MKDFKGRGGFNDRGGNRGGFGDRNNDRGGFGDRPRFGGDKPRFGGDKPRFGGKPGFGGKPAFKKFGERHVRDDAPREMFSATCSECRSKCEVPFRPSGDKPVFCNNCFGAQKESGTGNFAPKPRFDKGFDKPRFENNDRNDKRIDELKAQVAELKTQMKEVLALVRQNNDSESVATPTSPVVLEASAKKAPAKKVAKKAAEKAPEKKAPAQKAVAKKAPAKKAVKKAAAKK